MSDTLIPWVQDYDLENRHLVTDEPVEFEKYAVEVEDCRKFTDHFRVIYRIYRRMSARNRLDLHHKCINSDIL